MPKFSDASIEVGTGSVEFAEVDSKGKVKDTNTPLVQPKTPGIKGPRPNLQVPKEDENISFIVVSGTNALKNERVLVAGSGIKIIDEGPNKNIVVALDDNSLIINGSIDFQRNGVYVGTRPRINFIPGSSVSIDVTDDSINNRVNVSVSAFVPSIAFEVSSKGNGQDLYSGVSASKIILRTITVGGGLDLQVSADTIIISAPPVVISALSLPTFTFTNNGGGAQVAQNISANVDFNFRTIIGGGIVEVNQGLNTITISAANNAADSERIRNTNNSVSVDTSSSTEGNITFITNSAIRMVITSAGRVGIGTTSPNAQLEIFDATTSSSFIQFFTPDTGVGSSDGVTVGISAGNLDFIIRQQEDAGIVFETNSQERMVITSGGRVGIGTSAPTEQFEVFGTAKFSFVAISANGQSYKLPTSAGVSGQYLRTRGIGLELYWDNVVGGGANVTLSAYGTGADLFLGVSGGTELRYRTIVGNNIEVSAGANEIVISAQVFTQNVTLSSMGTGTSLAVGVSANREVQIRSLTAGGIIDITTVGNTINISARQSPQTISALGGGTSNVIGVSGNELQFRTFTAGGIINIAISGNTINVSAPALAQNVTLSSLGGGTSLAVGVSGNREVQIRSLTAGGIIEITTSSNTVNISARQSPVTLSALGGGVNMFQGVSGGTELRYRTFVGNNIEVSATTNTVIFSALPQNVTLSSMGTGTSLAVGVSANREVQIRSLTGGGIIDIAIVGNTVNISAAAGAFTQAPVTLSALGAGANIFVGVSGGTELRYRTLVGSNIEVSAGAAEIIISAKPSQVEALLSGVSVGTNFTAFDFVPAFATENGETITVSANGATATVTTYIPRLYRFRVNAGASTAVDTVDPVSALPAGWTFSSATSTSVTVIHGLNRRHRHYTVHGFSTAFGYRSFGGSTTVNMQTPSDANQIRFNVGSVAAGLSENNGHYIIEVIF